MCGEQAPSEANCWGQVKSQEAERLNLELCGVTGSLLLTLFKPLQALPELYNLHTFHTPLWSQFQKSIMGGWFGALS